MAGPCDPMATMMKRALLALFLWQWLPAALSVTPQAVLYLRQSSEELYASDSSFGDDIPSYSYSFYRRLVKPVGGSDGCSPGLPDIPLKGTMQYFFLVERGNCSFQDKVEAAEGLGASGVVVYNSPRGIYGSNDYASSSDYECDNGEGYVSDITYPVYDMDSSMPEECTLNSKCSSGRCVLTGSNATDLGYQVCCAWDLYETMGSADDSFEATVPAVFISMADFDTLSLRSELDSLTLEVRLYSRSSGSVEYATVVIFLLAILTALVGSMRAANADKIVHFTTKERYIDDPGSEHASEAEGGGGRSGEHVYRPVSSSDEPAAKKGIAGPRPDDVDNDEGFIEISPRQALLYVCLSSVFIVIMYFLNVNFFITVVYLIAGMFAMLIMTFYPLCLGMQSLVVDCFVEYTDNSNRFFDYKQYDSMLVTEGLGRALKSGPALVVASAASAAVAVLWYITNDMGSLVADLLQDFIGFNMCILFLLIIRLPNFKTATLLLTLAFIYDVFFTFVSPYIFGSSVMVKVASSETSESVKNDENYCEKYPTSDDCKSDQLPMMFIVPPIDSYYSGDSILGLGDVVIPGLLLAWAARVDTRRYGSLYFASLNGGFFVMTLAAYGCGLILADVAVSYFQSGQPALLYIVPLTVGSVAARAYKAGILAKLWSSMPSMKLVALPVHEDERNSLLGSDVMETQAQFLQGKRERAVLLEPGYAVVTPVMEPMMSSYGTSGQGLGQEADAI